MDVPQPIPEVSEAPSEGGSDTQSACSAKIKGGRAADQIWDFFSTVNDPKTGKPQGAHNRSHRVCKCCNTTISSASVLQGEEHMACKKSHTKHPKVFDQIHLSRSTKVNKLGNLPPSKGPSQACAEV